MTGSGEWRQGGHAVVGHANGQRWQFETITNEEAVHLAAFLNAQQQELAEAQRERDLLKDEWQESDGPWPAGLAVKVREWLTSNGKTADQVRHGRFPLAMVERWIQRAEAAEEREQAALRALEWIAERVTESLGGGLGISATSQEITDWYNGWTRNALALSITPEEVKE